MLIVSKSGEIQLTRGDTARLTVDITDDAGQAYSVQNDDSGCNYDYENGEYSRIKITYDNSTGKIKLEQKGKDEFAHNLTFAFI